MWPISPHILGSPVGMLLLRLMLLAPLDLPRIAAVGLLSGHGNAAGKNAGHHVSFAHHGQEWHDGQCGSRARQSPIDFGPAAPWNCQLAQSPPAGCYKGPVYFQYQVIDKGFPLSNFGHKLSADLRGEGYGGVTYNDQWFEIVSVDFHVQAEHTFMGEHMPIELNIVHKNVDSEQLLIVGLPFEIPNVSHSALLEAQAAGTTKVAKQMALVTAASSSPAEPVHTSDLTVLRNATQVVDQRAVPANPQKQEKHEHQRQDIAMPRRRGSLASTATAVSSNGSLRVELLSMSIPERGGGRLRNSGARLLVVGEVMGRPDSTKGMPVPVTAAGNSGPTRVKDRSNEAAQALRFPHYARGDTLRFSAYDSDGSLLGQTTLHSDAIFGSAASAAATMQTEASGGGLQFEGDLALLKGSRGSGSLRVKALLPVAPTGPAVAPLLLQQQQRKRRQGIHSRSSRKATTLEAPAIPGAGGASPFGRELGALMSDPVPSGGKAEEVRVVEEADRLSPLVVGATFFEYQGSLTAPPCTEQVTWLVRRDRLTATQAQFEALRSAILQANSNFGNWRSTMPLMGREVFVRVASLGMPPTAPVLEASQAQQQQRSKTDGLSGDKATVLHAEAEAEDALVAARDAESLTRSIQSVVPLRPYAMLAAGDSVVQALPPPQLLPLDDEE